MVAVYYLWFVQLFHVRPQVVSDVIMLIDSIDVQLFHVLPQVVSDVMMSMAIETLSMVL